jgi:hypothetical protein
MSIAIPSLEATPAFTIEVDDIAAGIALRERTGFRFVAADPRFRLLDGSHFRRLGQIEAAARNLARANLPVRRLHFA